MRNFTESVVEKAALDWFRDLGYSVASGADIAPGEPGAEREGWGDVALRGRLRAAIDRLNPDVAADAREEAFRMLTRAGGPSLVDTNHALHRMLIGGVEVEYRRPDGSIGGQLVRVLDFDKPEENDWLVVNQFSVKEGNYYRRADIVVFVNGLPLGVLELKNAAKEDATIDSAFLQLQTYMQEIPSLFAYNEALVISDGTSARMGTITANRERYMPWRTIGGQELAGAGMAEIQVVIEGVFEPRRFLDLVHYFIVFEETSGPRLKKLAGYHQYHAVNVAVEETLRASLAAREPAAGFAEEQGRYFSGGMQDAEDGDRRIGVVWHTQGSGKSLTMAFYAGRIAQHPAMENPTVVVITDRNDLDDQLHGTFSGCRDLLRQEPVKADSAADLRSKLHVESGGVVFTTIHKFLPEERGAQNHVLSERRNIVVIADEAHRSQYDFVDGFAARMREALPNASFIGFTGTPIEQNDKNTRAVFGDHISVYDIQRAVEDGATVPIYYESRLAKLELNEELADQLDEDFEEVTEGEEQERKEKLKTKWGQLAALVGSESRMDLVARDLVEHFEQRLEVMDGKAVVVCMSREICMNLHDKIRALRPAWYDEDDDKGAMKVVMTGSASEGPRVAEHARNKARREALANRFRDASDPFKLVIVRDMWLTGFDAPCLHTMYVDKPMRGHGLMQAIARVNRVFRDKPGGLVVDYIGIADQLKRALATYTERGGKGEAAIDTDRAIAAMREKYEICRNLFHGFDHSAWIEGNPQERTSIIPAAQEHILQQKDGKEALKQAVLELMRAYALVPTSDEARTIRDDVYFFQVVNSALNKRAASQRRSDEEMEHAIRQLVSQSVSSNEVVDIFASAGLSNPNISVLSDEFLAEVRGMPHRNLAIETLRKLLEGEIQAKSRKNVVQARSFRDLIADAIRRYQNRAIESAEVIDELITLAKDFRKAAERGQELGLNDDELAFYDALAANESAVDVLGDGTLRDIARELVERVSQNVSIDWTMRENVRAQLRVLVKRILRRHGYPPDKQEAATETVLQQAETLSEEWLAA